MYDCFAVDSFVFFDTRRHPENGMDGSVHLGGRFWTFSGKHSILGCLPSKVVFGHFGIQDNRPPRSPVSHIIKGESVRTVVWATQGPRHRLKKGGKYTTVAKVHCQNKRPGEEKNTEL